MSEPTLRLPREAWVVVADRRKALLLRNDGTAAAANLCCKAVVLPGPPMAGLERNRLVGHFNKSDRSRRGTFVDEAQNGVRRRAFSIKIAHELKAALAGRTTSGIVIAAPPKLLGELRRALEAGLRQLVIAEIARELTQFPIHEIERQLRAIPIRRTDGPQQ